MSELAERFEVLVEAFARKIAALAIDAAEQKGRADRAEAEVERLRREYEPGYPAAGDALVDAVSSDTPPGAGCKRCILWPILANQRDELQQNVAAEKKRAEGWKQQAGREQDAHAATTAKLATIVAAVEKNFIAEPSEYRDEDGDGVAFGPVTFVCQHCGMHGDTAATIDHEQTCSYVEIKRALSATDARRGSGR
jgi:hypothetical protein